VENTVVTPNSLMPEIFGDAFIVFGRPVNIEYHPKMVYLIGYPIDFL